MFVDAVQVLKDGAVTETQGFESGLAPWVAGPQPAGTENAAGWVARGAVGFIDGPGIATDDTLLWGFGLEGVTTRAERSAALKDAIDLPDAFASRRRRRSPGPPPATYGTSQDGTVGGTVPGDAVAHARHGRASSARSRRASRGRTSPRRRRT